MPRRTQPMPDDFPLYAAKEGNLKLRKRFGVGGIAVERWRRQCGLSYTPLAMPKPTRPIMARKAKKRWMAQEQIEDLDDGFDLGRCVASGGYGEW
jgi:hypothetical protein